jgi:uncharacterized protein (DUF2249 family)
MKAKVNIAKWIGATVVFTILSGFSNPEFPESVTATMLDDQRFELEARNPLKMDMTMQLSNSQTEEIVYDHDIPNTDRYHVIYNLKNLTDGMYTLKYTIDKRIYEKEILLKDSEVQLLAETVYQAPSFYHDEDKGLFVTIFNPWKEEVSVSFWKGAEKFFTDKPGNFSSLRRQYSLSYLDPGEYDVNVNAGDESYTYRLEVK